MSFAGTPTAWTFALLFPCNSPSFSCEIFLCMFLSCSFICHSSLLCLSRPVCTTWSQNCSCNIDVSPTTSSSLHGSAPTIVLRSALGFYVSPPLFPVCTVSLDVLCTLQHFQSLIMARPLTLWDPLLLDIYFAMPTRVWTDTHRTQFHLLWGSTSTRCCILVCSP